MVNSKQQQGFTFIELMLVVGIIGILSALSIATYSFYSTRARIAEAMLVASTAKLYVVENGMTGTPAASGWSLSQTTVNLLAVDIGPDGTITVTTADRAGDGTVLFVPEPKLVPGVPTTKRLTWTCQAGTIKPILLPAQCRE